MSDSGARGGAFLPRAEVKALVERLFPHEDAFGALVGYQFEGLDPDLGTSRVSLAIAERHLSPSGAVHGGVLSTLIDFAMGAAIFGRLSPGQLCSTIEFKINYLSPVRLGESVIGTAQVAHCGRSHAVVEAALAVDERRVVTALGTYNLYRPRDSRD